MQILLFILGMVASHGFAMWVGWKISGRDASRTLDELYRRIDQLPAARNYERRNLH